MRLRTLGLRLALSVALAVAAVATVLSPIRAQEPGEAALQGHGGVGLMMAEPVGEFGEVIGVGWGVGGHVRWFEQGPLSVRLDLGFIEYGRRSKRVCLSFTVGCRIEVDLVTSNNIVSGSLGPHLGVTRGPIRPYVTAGVGFSWFSTQSNVQGVNDFQDADFSTNNYGDLALALTAAAGFTIPLTRGRTPVSLDLAARYHRNGEAEYLTEDDIVDEPDGSITVFPNRSAANLVTFQLGVSIGIPSG